jgi:hypothetical protein
MTRASAGQPEEGAKGRPHLASLQNLETWHHQPDKVSSGAQESRHGEGTPAGGSCPSLGQGQVQGQVRPQLAGAMLSASVWQPGVSVQDTPRLQAAPRFSDQKRMERGPPGGLEPRRPSRCLQVGPWDRSPKTSAVSRGAPHPPGDVVQ